MSGRYNKTPKTAHTLDEYGWIDPLAIRIRFPIFIAFTERTKSQSVWQYETWDVRINGWKVHGKWEGALQQDCCSYFTMTSLSLYMILSASAVQLQTSQYRRIFIPLSVSLWNDLAAPVSGGVGRRISRAGPMIFYWHKLLYPYCSLLQFILFSSFCL